MHSLTRRSFVGLLGGSGLALAAHGQDPATQPAAGPYPRTIVLVRHAEKAAEPADDPGLSPAGERRAHILSAALGHSGVTHLFATEFARTQKTLQPLATRAGLTVRTVRGGDTAAQLHALAQLPRGAVAVVAGHSNTVPGLVGKLTGGSTKVTIADEEYDRLFVVTQWGAGKAEALAFELRYGGA